MENKLVPREGFEIRTVRSRAFKHKTTPAALWWNIRAMAGFAAVIQAAGRIVDTYKPDVVVGTGGFASFPVVYSAAVRGISTAIHESNAVPGLATRALAGRVDRIMVGFEDSVRHYKHRERIVITGTPVRDDFIYGNKAEAKRQLMLDDRPVVAVTFGSLGAREMNKMMADYIELLSANAAFQLIYATGKFGARWMPELVLSKGVDLQRHSHIQMHEYIYNMPVVMTAADLMITRSGASTLSELAITAAPAILIPSPNVSGNHQEKNARSVERKGGAEVILERQCSGRILFERTKALLAETNSLEKMKNAMRGLAILDANERIYQTITDLADR
jgi:UDP-N-acetylglucosamine--N-acetylmuramyl-(pentapeptide) pyrophosphoryl-undecaprenol N-acetylglucosamine transferase